MRRNPPRVTRMILSFSSSSFSSEHGEGAALTLSHSSKTNSNSKKGVQPRAATQFLVVSSSSRVELKQVDDVQPSKKSSTRTHERNHKNWIGLDWSVMATSSSSSKQKEPHKAERSNGSKSNAVAADGDLRRQHQQQPKKKTHKRQKSNCYDDEMNETKFDTNFFSKTGRITNRASESTSTSSSTDDDQTTRSRSSSNCSLIVQQKEPLRSMSSLVVEGASSSGGTNTTSHLEQQQQALVFQQYLDDARNMLEQMDIKARRCPCLEATKRNAAVA